MTTTKKRPEVLVPAGTLEKVEVAVNYGTNIFSLVDKPGLRSRAGETLPWMKLREGIRTLLARGVVHVASNMVTHEMKRAGEVVP